MKDKNKIIQIVIHIAFFLFIAGVILTVFLKFSSFINGGKLFNQEEIESGAENLPTTESMDFILPLMVDSDHVPEDDGKTTIVCFGNSPFSDGRHSDTNVCSLIAEETGAEVYNCSIPGSFLSAYNHSFFPESEPLDAFSFYWLTTAFCLDNFQIFDRALEAMPDASPDVAEAVELLKSIDFEKVDVIALMYDGSDYLAGREMYSDENFTDPQQFTGSMAAGIELIQQYYPHIRIIVMSPTYAYGVEEDGTYVSSDIKTYGRSFLSTYVIKQAQAAYELSVSFVDNLYGTIHEDIASDYLTDNIHLNEKGRKLVAERFVYALNRYPDAVIQD